MIGPSIMVCMSQDLRIKIYPISILLVGTSAICKMYGFKPSSVTGLLVIARDHVPKCSPSVIGKTRTRSDLNSKRLRDRGD